jgi:hypothetical protein
MPRNNVVIWLLDTRSLGRDVRIGVSMFVEIEEMKSSTDEGVETASRAPIAGQGAEPTVVVALLRIFRRHGGGTGVRTGVNSSRQLRLSSTISRCCMDIKKIFRIFRRHSGGTSVHAGGISSRQLMLVVFRVPDLRSAANQRDVITKAQVRRAEAQQLLGRRLQRPTPCSQRSLKLHRVQIETRSRWDVDISCNEVNFTCQRAAPRWRA